MKFSNIRLAALFFTAQLLVAGVAHAQFEPEPTYPPRVRLSGTGIDPVILTNDTLTQLPSGEFVLTGTQIGAIGADPGWQIEWNLTVNQQLYTLLGSVAGTVTLTNLSTIARDFFVNVPMPFDRAAFRETLTAGRISGRLEDFNDDGSARLGNISARPDMPIFTGDTNFSTVLQMFRVGLSCTDSGGGCVASRSETDPPGFRRTGFASSMVQTWLSFNLSPGDRVTFDTALTVQPVPLPAALPLFLLVLAPLSQLARKGRRTAR